MPVSTVEGGAKQLATKLFGPDGSLWGTPLTTLEDHLLQRREVLTEELARPSPPAPVFQYYAGENQRSSPAGAIKKSDRRSSN